VVDIAPVVFALVIFGSGLERPSVEVYDQYVLP
jgi:hypothetical protein